MRFRTEKKSFGSGMAPWDWFYPGLVGRRFFLRLALVLLAPYPALWLAACLSSCTVLEEASGRQSAAGPVRVAVRLSLADAAGRNLASGTEFPCPKTPSGCKSIIPEGLEDKISSVLLAAYEQPGGALAARHYYTGEGCGNLSLTLSGGRSYRVCALVNTEDVDLPLFETGLEDFVLRLPAYPRMAEEGIPMAAQAWCDDPSGAAVSLCARRLLARVRFVVDLGSISPRIHPERCSFDRMDVRLHRANTRLCPFGCSAARSPQDCTDGDQDGFLSLNAAGQRSLSDTVVLYVPENLQGTLLEGNDDPWKKDPMLWGADSLLFGRLTYVSFTARLSSTLGYSGTVSYRFYLGENTLDNFDIWRNTARTVSFRPTPAGAMTPGTWKIERGEDWKDLRRLQFFLPAGRTGWQEVEPGHHFELHESDDGLELYFAVSRNGGGSYQAGEVGLDWNLRVNGKVWRLPRIVSGSSGLLPGSGRTEDCPYVFPEDSLRLCYADVTSDASYTMSGGRLGNRLSVIPTGYAPGALYRVELRTPEGALQTGFSFRRVFSLPAEPSRDLMDLYVGDAVTFLPSGADFPAGPFRARVLSGPARWRCGVEEGLEDCTSLSVEALRLYGLEEGEGRIRLETADGRYVKEWDYDLAFPVLSFLSDTLVLTVEGSEKGAALSYLGRAGRRLEAARFDSLLWSRLLEPRFALREAGPAGPETFVGLRYDASRGEAVLWTRGLYREDGSPLWPARWTLTACPADARIPVQKGTLGCSIQAPFPTMAGPLGTVECRFFLGDTRDMVFTPDLRVNCRESSALEWVHDFVWMNFTVRETGEVRAAATYWQTMRRLQSTPQCMGLKSFRAVLTHLRSGETVSSPEYAVRLLCYARLRTAMHLDGGRWWQLPCWYIPSGCEVAERSYFRDELNFGTDLGFPQRTGEEMLVVGRRYENDGFYQAVPYALDFGTAGLSGTPVEGFDEDNELFRCWSLRKDGMWVSQLDLRPARDLIVRSW